MFRNQNKVIKYNNIFLIFLNNIAQMLIIIKFGAPGFWIGIFLTKPYFALTHFYHGIRLCNVHRTYRANNVLISRVVQAVKGNLELKR